MRRTLTIAWILTGLAVLLALLGRLPPFSPAILRLVVFGDEASPLLSPFTVLALPAVLLLGRGSRLWHRLVMSVLVITALCFQLWPLYSSYHVPDSKGYSFLRALRGDALDAEIAERRVTYRAADGSPLELLLLRSTATEQDARPTLIVLNGDRWRDAAPDQALDVSRYFARRGYTVVALDYRPAPRHRHPAQIDDVRAGLVLLRDSATAWGIDPSRVSIVGRSAGGQLALLAAYQPRPAGAPPELPIRSVVAFYAPYDLAGLYRQPPRPDPTDIRAALRDYLGGSPDEVAEQYRLASPATHVRRNLPPTLLIYAHHDHVVPGHFGREAAKDMIRADAALKYVELGWAEHGFDLFRGGVGNQVATDLLQQFFGQTLR